MGSLMFMLDVGAFTSTVEWECEKLQTRPLEGRKLPSWRSDYDFYQKIVEARLGMLGWLPGDPLLEIAHWRSCGLYEALDHARIIISVFSSASRGAVT